ncbi:MAG: Flp family type IVb pilin [Acidimicrobiia bacterium]
MLSQLVQMLQARIANDERGAAAVEYGMLVALIAAVVIAIVFTLGGQINDAFTKVSEGFKGNF